MKGNQRLMQFLCLLALDRKDQGFTKMPESIRIEFEETNTGFHQVFLICFP